MSDEGKDRIDNCFCFVCKRFKTWQDFGRLGRLRVFQTPNNSSLRKASNFFHLPPPKPKPPKPPETNFCVGPSQPAESESPPLLPNPRLTFEVEGNIGRPLNGVSLARAHQLSRLRLSAANANRWPLQRQFSPRGAFDQMSVGHGGPGRCRPCPGVRAVTAADRR